MASVCLSCVSKKDLSAVIITDNGKLVTKRVERIKDEEVACSTYLSLIVAFTVGLNMLKMYVEEHQDIDEVVFECNNSAFIKWVNQGYSRDEYHNEFSKMLELLNDIPIRYSFSYNRKPKSLMFTDEKYIVREKLGGLLD